jgi:hypothetical protein
MHNKNRKSPAKMSRLTVTALTFIVLFLFPRPAAAEGLVTPQVFARGNFVFVVDQQRIVFLSMDTRSSHPLYRADDEIFNIVSAVRYGDMIWASTAIGAVIAVNMQTGTIEEFSRGLVSGGGHIAVDRRFVWLAANDTLYRMDLTSREWISLPVPNNGGGVRGLISFNDQIHIISERAVHILTTASEDWVVIPHKNFTLTRGDFRKIDGAGFLTQERALYYYDASKRILAKGEVRGKIRAADLSPERQAVATGNRIYHFNTNNFILESQPALPILRGIRAFTRHNGQTVCVTGKGLTFNATSPFNFDIVAYPDYLPGDGDVFAFSFDGHIILYSGDNFTLYHPDRRLWTGIRIMNRAGRVERRGLHGWSEEGAHINITEEVHSNLHGIVTLRQQPGISHTETDGIEIDLGIPFVNTTLNIHTEDQDGRTLDITIDNAQTTVPPQKGFYYRGTVDDILNRASFGIHTPPLAASGINTPVVAEGGSAVFTSRTKIPGSDRNLFSATAGSGHVLSKTEWRTFGHERSGIYRLYTDVSKREILGSTIRVYIDGIPLQQTDYVYDPASSSVRLLRREKSNPTSIIHISFSEKTLPEDPFAFEPLPENHFGQYNFVEGAVSPRSWLGVRAGLLTLGDATWSGYRPESGMMVTAGIPVELRGGANQALLLHPEIAYDARMGTHSTGFTAGAREGRTFGSYRGLWTGRDFNNIDPHRHDFIYHKISDEHELNLGYDLRNNLRAGWYQLHRRLGETNLSHFEMRSSYTGNGYLLPSADISVSSQLLDYGPDIDRRDRKETFTMRLSDPSSRFLAETNRLHSVGYDLFWTEYQNNMGQRGRVLYGQTSVSPTSPLMLTGSWLYRLNPTDFHIREEVNPQLSVYTSGLPRGFDLGGHYTMYISALTDGGSNVGMSRGIFGFFYPGEYVESLNKFALYLRYGNNNESHAYPVVSPMKYTFFTDENTYMAQTSEEIGLISFPTENILISTLNSRYRDHILEETYYSSRERIKIWLDGGSSLEGNAHIAKSPRQFYMYADGLYEHRFNGGLLAGMGLFGERNSDEEVIISGGPQFILSQTTDLNNNIFKNIEHSHRARIALNTADISKPDVNYILYLRLRLPPNISVVAEMGLAVTKLDNVSGAGGAYLHAGF